MEKLRFTFSFVAKIVAASLAMSCGASQDQNQLRSLTLSPATADAQNYPDGQVPFTATTTLIRPKPLLRRQQIGWPVSKTRPPLKYLSPPPELLNARGERPAHTQSQPGTICIPLALVTVPR
jgi:hypothetical protein